MAIEKVELINEYGLYQLLFASEAPIVKDFKHWLSHEVLPSIRKTGQYVDEDGKFEKYMPFSECFNQFSDMT